VAGPRGFTFVTLNLWGDRAPLAHRLELAAAGLAALGPDVIALQEVRRGDALACTATALCTRLSAYTGQAWHTEVRPATIGPAGTWGPGSGAGEEGLALCSPHPLGAVRALELPEARPVERRILLSAWLSGPGLWVHTTHLHWRGRDAAARAAQLAVIDAAARSLGPGPHVLGGDLNAAPDTVEIHGFAGRGWVDTFATHRPGDPGLTWAARNPNTASLAQVAPLDRRIDYVWTLGADAPASVDVVLDTPDPAGVFASDHFGVAARWA
jgi:endonuclease/exonuclease/phosphatase family metal-dependent hydrolase